MRSLHLYPVKSTAGVSVAQAVVEPWGLAGDRRWSVVDEAGNRLVAWDVPRLLRVRAVPTPDGVRLSAAGRPDLVVCRPDPTVRVASPHSRLATAVPAGPAAADWLSELLDRPVTPALVGRSAAATGVAGQGRPAGGVPVAGRRRPGAAHRAGLAGPAGPVVGRPGRRRRRAGTPAAGDGPVPAERGDRRRPAVRRGRLERAADRPGAVPAGAAVRPVRVHHHRSGGSQPGPGTAADAGPAPPLGRPDLVRQQAGYPGRQG